MCGIVGLVGETAAAPRLIEGLRRLEYRGYDSTGVATIFDKQIAICRAAGKLINLEGLIEKSPIYGNIGIGHTRWATHGVPSSINAHPHATESVAVVHNGIIENFSSLKSMLESEGHKFCSDTDSEVIPKLIHHLLEQGHEPIEAVAAALKKLKGAFALGIIFAGYENLLIGARRGAPLAVGSNEKESFLASDAFAMAPFTRTVSYLEEGDCAVLRPGITEIFDGKNRTVNRISHETEHDEELANKSGYQHFMEKEIHEQPRVIRDTLNSYYNSSGGKVFLPNNSEDLFDFDQLYITACGTSFYAGLTARYWMESIARIPVIVDIASEFRYRGSPLNKNGTALFISQSGETADTLAALNFAKNHGQKIISVVNVAESTMARESDLVLPTRAGIEIGVASTKAFTTQLVALACFSIALAMRRGSISEKDGARLANLLEQLPVLTSDLLKNINRFTQIADELSEVKTVLYLGRGSSYPIALEGALKLKEISYIHAEGYAAGEMKHGPIALIEEGTPVIFLAPSSPLYDKTASNIQEAAARGARVILLSDQKGINELDGLIYKSIEMPEADEFIAPILYTIPIQLLAYYTAVCKGTDVDQPRNLAKSVTVE